MANRALVAWCVAGRRKSIAAEVKAAETRLCVTDMRNPELPDVAMRMASPSKDTALSEADESVLNSMSIEDVLNAFKSQAFSHAAQIDFCSFLRQDAVLASSESVRTE